MDIMAVLEQRFEMNHSRHPHLTWQQVAERLKKAPQALVSLEKMEQTGGEPDVIGQTEDGRVLFCDCSKESPLGRRSLCFDREALDKRKHNKPAGDAMSMAEEIGIRLLDRSEYLALQQTGDYDLRSSSWIRPEEKIRRLGGALFGDKRYDETFIYYNGADSYYASRGFRGMLEV